MDSRVNSSSDGILDTVRKYSANTLFPPNKAILIMARKEWVSEANNDSDTPLAYFRGLQKNRFEAAVKAGERETANVINSLAVDKTWDPRNRYKIFQLQYNPTTIGYRGVGGSYTQISGGMGNMSENQIQQMTMDISTTLTAQLVFSDIDLSDAFLYNKAEGGAFWALLGAGKSLAEGIASKLSDRANAYFNKSHSVEKYVDGFIGAITKEGTRRVFFAWGKNTFQGLLTRATGTFKMFNTRGEPILATVDIEIRQNYDKEFDDMFWRKRFTKVFKEVQM